MIAVVDYGMGNIHSVRHAFITLGADVVVTNKPEELRAAERIVLPGVGAFGECMKNLRAAGVLEVLSEEVRSKKKPFLGICLGMQVLASVGEELGRNEGLDWIPGTVKRLEVDKTKGLVVPHVGWNEVRWAPHHEAGPLFKGLRQNGTFYFVHSFVFVPTDPKVTAGICEYGDDFTCAVLEDNVFATQFHPEKSQQNGLTLLSNFLDWKP